MANKPKRHDIQLAKEILKRWYLQAKYRGKTTAMEETKRIYELLQYFEDVTDWRIL
ncbi:hypothetical protein [Spirochaeta isovalerica]|uniref:Uncharacterized protein n=1 Tax=Spirochaeta isovalerica TaxID=150 RepID=A0A841RDR0_9SPIO|nr:hypothetical protein [Spirochaeta isovalerica]MBB6481521.1 hypothetical protein [Spirochaeta isovalerica]